MEIAIGVLFVLGVFLLVEDLEIKLFIYHGFVSLFKTLAGMMNDLLQRMGTTIRRIEGSDIVGSIFIALAMILLLYRVRQKAIARYSELSECPECGENLIMAHRNLFQKVISRLFRVKIRRFRCKACDFDGLRIRSMHSR